MCCWLSVHFSVPHHFHPHSTFLASLKHDMQEQQQQEQKGQAHYRPLPPLPPEILSLIFAHLPITSLLSCTLVSRLWYHESKPHLFSAETFRLERLPHISSDGTRLDQAYVRLYSPAYIAAIKDNKRCLRSVSCILTRRSDLPIAEVLEILFDCPRELLPLSVGEADSGDIWVNLDRATAAAAAAFHTNATIADDNGAVATTTTTPSSSKVVPGILLGQNRPALQVFMYDGKVMSSWLFETMIYNLPTLTTLDLYLGCHYVDLQESACLDIDMILDALPRLKSLVIDGSGYHYTDNAPSSSTSTTGTTTMPLHPLESFKFTPLLVMRSTVNTLATFRRLKNLKSIFINTNDTYYNPVTRQAKPGEFGQILQRYCPKIERVETEGSLVLWFCRLPPTSLPCEDIRLLTNSGTASELSVRELDEGLNVTLTHQEREDILTNYQEITLFFPQLKALIARGYQSMGVQDLLALAVSRSQFLTHLEIGRGNYWNNAFELLQDARPDLPSSPSIEGIDQITVYPPGPMTSSEMRWMRRRRAISSLDYQRVLETCSALRVVSLPGGMPFRHMVDDPSDINGVETRMTRRWACEGTIETLNMGFVLSTARRDDHRLIWRHLGRLRKLRCLTLTHSNLIPSLDFGISELVGRDFSQHDNDNHDDAPLTGEGDDKQRLREHNTTLEKLHSLGVAWGVDDRATTQWFARSFPNLQTAGLGFRWGTAQHKRVRGWLDEVGCSFELEFTNDKYRQK
ncbi:hypothetical protein KI688_012511 [Linnemannia hyalina]|uniref:F-box domain-containing protein n=1 Tax=Linnemannia hyalina TaxID=64524 RepID=A0A9P7XTZ6_9FUNG|nr:hypothetical protein KI688_012511 [Linnemannia hyalina]